MTADLGSRPRLLFVGNFLSGALAHRHYCEDLTERLEARGWVVLKTSTSPRRSRRPLDMVRFTVVNRERFDLAHVDVYSGTAFLWAEAVCFALRRLHVPYVLTLHGGNLPEFARLWPRRIKYLLQTAAVVTSPSEYLAEQVKPHAGKVIVIPNAIDTKSLPFTLRKTPKPNLIWVRSFHKIYNPVMAVDVLANLSRKHPEATLTMIGHDKGDGSLENVRRRSRQHGVKDRLTIIPGIPKSEVGDHLRNADVFLNTTNIDNTPVSVLEAMATGLCVVSTAVGGIPYLLRNGTNALLVPAGDAQQMTDAVCRLLGDAALAGQLSANARAHALGCEWEPVLDRWEAIFRAPITSRGRPCV